MGPLVGEYYVRFLGGGAFAVSSHILKSIRQGEEKGEKADEKKEEEGDEEEGCFA